MGRVGPRNLKDTNVTANDLNRLLDRLTAVVIAALIGCLFAFALGAR